MDTKLERGEKFFHKDLNKLICCRDKHFNHCYDEGDYNKHLIDTTLHFTVDNSGSFHTSQYRLKNDWKEFIVIWSNYGGGGTGMGPHDIYPDAWQVYCSPVDHPNVLIKFHQETNCFAHTIKKVQLL